MYCWKCGAQVRDGASFCERCGTDLRRKDAAPRYEAGSGTANTTGNTAANTTGNTAANTTASAPARKKSRFSLKSVLILAGAILLGRAAGYALGYGTASVANSTGKKTDAGKESSAVTATFQAPKDVITLHSTLMRTYDNGLTEYATLFYGSDTHTLTAWTQELLAPHDHGYAVNDLRAADLEKLFPPFAEFTYTEENGYAYFTARMKSLKDSDRLQALVDYDWLELESTSKPLQPVDVDGLLRSMRDNGWTDAPITENGKLHFD